MYTEFRKSVIDLADKLPQWNSPEDRERTQLAAISSLYEECGELCGCFSKYFTRGEHWRKNKKELEDFEKAKEKFTDEASDLLWVLVCAGNYICNEDFYSIFDNKNEQYSLTIDTALFDIMRDINILRQDIMFDEENIKAIRKDFQYLAISYLTFVEALNEVYDITFDDICKYNINKLNKRYDSTGKRVD